MRRPLPVQQGAPIARDSTLGAWDRLIYWMRARRLQFFARDHGVFSVVVKPILTRFEAGNNRMSVRFGMLGGVLARRAITAADVTALRAAPKMQPPSAGRQAFHAAISTRFRSGVDSAVMLGSLLHRVAPLRSPTKCFASNPRGHRPRHARHSLPPLLQGPQTLAKCRRPGCEHR